MGGNYPLLEAKTTANGALENFAKLSSMISTAYPVGAGKIDLKFDLALDTLVSDSPRKIDFWYREELPFVDRGGKDRENRFGDGW
jgi:hypothetical protein